MCRKAKARNGNEQMGTAAGSKGTARSGYEPS